MAWDDIDFFSRMEKPEDTCGVCSRPMHGTKNRCCVCGRRVCAFCAKRKGGFLGIGGKVYCPYCYSKG
jgi:hypothetical protein